MVTEHYIHLIFEIILEGREGLHFILSSIKEQNTEEGVVSSSITPFGQCVESLRGVKTSTYLPVLAPSVNTINTCTQLLRDLICTHHNFGV